VHDISRKNYACLLTMCTEELIAPSRITFFDSTWHEVGTKATLCQQIADITGIDPPVLQGEDDPRKRTVAERMSWTSGRSTSRIEDTAYSLMGLFNIFMPMLYGEGHRAFIRLQEEIMKQSEDYTIFAWKCAKPEPSPRGLFAQSPSEFGKHLHATDKMLPYLQTISRYRLSIPQLRDPATMTSRGLLITLPLLRKDSFVNGNPKPYKITGASCGSFNPFHFYSKLRRAELRSGTYMALICRVGAGRDERILCISLRKHAEDGIFTRDSPETLTLLPGKRLRDFKMHTIYALPSRTAGDEL
jgi:hypothetical protein